MKKWFSLRKLLLILLLPAAIVLINLASLFPAQVEKVYSRGFYYVVSQAISFLAGWIPFSLIEFVLIAFVILAVGLVVKGAVRLVKTPSGRGGLALNYVLNVCAFVCALYFIFVIAFDLNYQRLPFGKTAGLDVHPATVDELYAVCDSLAKHAGVLRTKVAEDPAGVMKLSESLTDTFKDASKGYEAAVGAYPVLAGTYSRPKGVVFSRALTLAGFQGIHSPLTQEANINTEISDCMIPSTACHEMAHQRGFAREDEANYISYLACGKNPGVDFQYSGVLLALIHSMNALYGADQEKFTQIYKEYDPGIIRDLTADSKFWRQFKGPVESISNSLNDAYLKANKQPEGVKSYGRMVDLLIAQYRKYGPEGM